MSTHLGPSFPPTWAGRPAHMSKEDAQLWEQARAQLVCDAVRLYFDVRLGRGPTHLWPEGQPIPPEWLAINQKRADVVVETPTRWKIIELRINAKASAVGRLLLYDRLWREDPPDARPVSLVLVTNTEDPEVRSFAEDMGIEYLRV